MAYAIARADIAPDTYATLTSMLCLVPEGNNTKYNSKCNNPKYNRGAKAVPINFYTHENGIMHVPYLFASSLFQIIPNMHIAYPHVPIQFIGNLRPYQVPVEEEAWRQLQTFGTTTLGLYPGFGKTILGARLASRVNLLCVILVHRELLTVQWKKTFEDFTNSVVWIVGEDRPPAKCDVIICMDTRWQLIPESIRDMVGLLIIDEAHAFCTPGHVRCLLSFHPKYIVAESASLLRDDGLHSMIYAICGNHGVFREVGKPFHVMKIITNTKPVRKMNRFGGVDWAALVSSTLADERRNKIIIELTAANLHRKILILTSHVDHVMALHTQLDERNIANDYFCSTKKSYQDSTVLVGTLSKIGTGFDQASFCDTFNGITFDLLILVCSIKKYSMLVQNVGRCFRSDSPIVMHLVDDDTIFQGHWYKARKWYLQHNGTITDYNVPNPNNVTPVMSYDRIEDFTLKRARDIAIHKQLSLHVVK